MRENVFFNQQILTTFFGDCLFDRLANVGIIKNGKIFNEVIIV
jgi:hypothetical protein